MLVSEIMDRTYSTWLNPAGINRPAFDTVATQGVLSGSSEGTFTVAGHIANIPADSIIEIDSELIRLTAVASTTLTTNGRGYLETVPTSHSVGAIVFVDPKFPRINLFNALKGIIGELFPKGLYKRSTQTLTWDTKQVAALAAGTLKILSVVVRRTGTYEQYSGELVEGRDYRVLYEFTPPKLRMIRGGDINQQATIVYKADFTLPSAETDDLDTLGIPSTLQPHLPMAIAGYLLQGREVPRVQIDDIRRSLAAQGVQVGAALNVGQTLLNTFWNQYVGPERRRQFDMDPTRFEVRRGTL